MNTTYEGRIAIYKANKNGTGTAAQFQLSRKNRCMFLEMARQTGAGDKTFDWQNKITVKLGETDITKMLSLFGGSWGQDALKLYHENPKGNKIINLNKQVNPKFPGYYLSVSVSEQDKKERISCPISPDETEYLKVGLARALEIILGW